jgi:hypothetical protein
MLYRLDGGLEGGLFLRFLQGVRRVVRTFLVYVMIRVMSYVR